MFATVHFNAVTSAVSMPSPLRDFPLNAYWVFGVKPTDTHGVLSCRQPELTVNVTFVKWIPELPEARLLGVFDPATLIVFVPTDENVRPDTASIRVYTP